MPQRRVTCYYFYVWDDDFGPAFVKVCAYFPYPMKVWAQRSRVGQAAGGQGRDRVQRAVQRVRRLHRSGRAAGDLRPAGPGRDPGVRRTLVVDPAVAADRARPRALAIGGSCRCAKWRPRAPWCSTHRGGPRVLRGPGGRQPRHRPPGADRADLQTRPTPRRQGQEANTRPRSSPTAPRSTSTPSTGTPASNSI